MNCNYEGSNCKFCEIDCNAPVTEQGASKINQLHNNTNEELLKEFIELRERFQSLYEETGLCSIENEYGIHLTERMFLNTFKDYEVSYFSENSPERLTAKYNGVVFFCIR
jgi:hypothetical protein